MIGIHRDENFYVFLFVYKQTVDRAILFQCHEVQVQIFPTKFRMPSILCLCTMPIEIFTTELKRHVTYFKCTVLLLN